jgi:hypothetical protein
MAVSAAYVTASPLRRGHSSLFWKGKFYYFCCIMLSQRCSQTEITSTSFREVSLKLLQDWSQPRHQAEATASSPGEFSGSFCCILASTKQRSQQPLLER